MDSKSSQLIANQLAFELREYLDRLLKIRSHRGMRHYWVGQTELHTARNDKYLIYMTFLGE